MSERARALAEGCFRAALRRVDAAAAVRRAVGGAGGTLRIAGERLPEGAALRVIAAGKAAAAMARALEEAAGDRIAGGVAVTKDGHGLPLARLALREAAHPVPDARCEAAAREVLAVARGRRAQRLARRAALGRRVVAAHALRSPVSRRKICAAPRAPCSRRGRPSRSSTPCAST